MKSDRPETSISFIAYIVISWAMTSLNKAISLCRQIFTTHSAQALLNVGEANSFFHSSMRNLLSGRGILPAQTREKWTGASINNAGNKS